MQKKLLYIIPQLGIGGAEVALLSAIPSLHKNYDFCIACLRMPIPGFISALSAEERARIRVFRGSFGLKYAKILVFVFRQKPDILVSSLWRGIALGCLSKMMSPRIIFVPFIHSSRFFNIADRFFTQLALRCCNVVFCDSLSSKTFVQQWVRKKRIEVISFLRFASPAAWQGKQKISAKALFVGRFHSAKRIDRIIDFVKALQERNIPIHLDMFGKDHGEMPTMKARVKEYQLEDAVSFCGECESSKIQDLLSQYDFYFQTSETEGMAMSVVEAMQQGLVCVLTPAGEIKNYAVDGENAIVFRGEFAEDFSRVVQSFCTVYSDLSLYNAMSKQAYLQFASAPSYPQSLCTALSKL